VQRTPYLVAIVDDEESVRRALGRLVRSAGFHVETFASGADFLSSIGRSAPNCVVLDMRMPHMNGFEVQLALTEQRSDIPVVIITGDDSSEIRQQTLSRGAKAYLRKPVDEAMLLDAIQSAIR
jgi:FixJ family two-component response regulator